MDYINNPLDLRRRLNAYAYSPDTPEALANRLQMIPGVDADVIVEGTEILYAHFDLLNDTGKEVLGLLAAYGVSQTWVSLLDRWTAIRDRVRRDLGERVAKIEDADMPPPQTARRDGAVDWRNPAPAEPEASPAAPPPPPPPAPES